ncbi:MAG: alpha/beta hydrolase [Candidatus Omnitrophica bacterium]|nr:alpha/beta hydrolase [Candidatus Omnitrophota bacterium]
MITSLLFYPDKDFYDQPENYGYDYENIHIETAGKIKLHAWYLKSHEERGCVLYLHGNAGNISGRLYKMTGWVERGFSVLLLDYRGYGASQGKIEQGEDIVEDAEAGLHWLQDQKGWALEKTILFGESLGTHPAIRLAVRYKAKALILEAPYTAFTDLAPIHYPVIPRFLSENLLKNFAFKNIDYIVKIQTPLLIIHGTEDPTCPYPMGQKLFELAPEPKAFFTVEGGEHNNLPEVAQDEYWQKPFEFIIAEK